MKMLYAGIRSEIDQTSSDKHYLFNFQRSLQQIPHINETKVQSNYADFSAFLKEQGRTSEWFEQCIKKVLFAGLNEFSDIRLAEKDIGLLLFPKGKDFVHM